MPQEKLKKLFANYPTGVTVVTNNYAGKIRAITVNSYTSLSLEPPLILFNLGKESQNIDAFFSSNHFAVNILADNQEHIANTCAQTKEDKLSDIPYHLNQHNIPLIHNALAHIECSKEKMIEVGDHYIVIGRVLKHNYQDNVAPLRYHNSSYQV